MPNRTDSEGLDDIAVFARVVEAGSFTAAAARLECSRPAVSKAVTRLEQRLGTRLLNRTTRRLSLTETGRTFYEQSARALREIQAARDAVSTLQSAPRGALRVNAPMSFAVLHVAPLLASFRSRYPEITVDIHLDDRKIDLVEEGFDVAIRIASLADSAYVARRLTACRHVICAAPAYIDESGAPRTPADLAQHRIVTYRLQTSSTRWEFRRRDGSSDVVDITPAIQMNNSLAIREAVLSGAGVTRTPTFVVGDDLRSGRLVPLLKDYESPEFAVFAMYPERRYLSPKVRAFVDFMAESLQDPPHWDGIG